MDGVIAKRKLKNSYYTKRGILGEKSYLQVPLWNAKSKIKQEGKEEGAILKIKKRVQTKILFQTITTLSVFVLVLILKKLNLQIISNSEKVKEIKAYVKTNYSYEEIKTEGRKIKEYIVDLVSPIIPEGVTNKTKEVLNNIITEPTKEESEVIIYLEEQPKSEEVKEITESEITFIKPTEGTVTSSFGYRKALYEGGEDFHYGVDIANVQDTHIFSSTAGTVSKIDTNKYMGNYIEITNGKVTTRYCHLNSVNVKLNQEVSQGEYIANMGTTGFSTGNHLHFEIMYDGVRVDPEQIITI